MRPIARLLPAGLIATAAALILSGCSQQSSQTPPADANAPLAPAAGGKKISVLLLPKNTVSQYFASCAKGAQGAAADLGINLIYQGPAKGSSAEAAKIIQDQTAKKVDVIAVSPNDADVVAPAMKAAKAAGVHVITWDADGEPATREFFVNQAKPEQIGTALVDTMVHDIGGTTPSGEIAIVTAALTAANQNEWIKVMQERLQAYPQLHLVDIKPCGEDQQKAVAVTLELIKAHPNLKGIFGISHLAFPGAAAAVKQAGKTGKILVTGLSTPTDMKPYLMDGTAKSVVTWNTEDLGYLTIEVANAVATGKLKPGMTTFASSKLGVKKIEGDNILLGDVLVITKDNFSKYKF